MTRLPEMYGELQLLLKILSMRVADVDIVQVWLTLCGRTRNEYTESKKFKMTVFVEYVSRSALKSSSKTNVLFSRERFSKRLAM